MIHSYRGIRTFPCAAAIFLLTASLQANLSFAQDRGVVVPDDPSVLLGETLSGIIARMGIPERVFAVRGLESWQDDVVFEYPGGLSFFIFKDRIWQVRISGQAAGSCFGLFVGDSWDKTFSMLGRPYHEETGAAEWRVPFDGFPVRLRILAKDDKIADVYVYRADF